MSGLGAELAAVLALADAMDGARRACAELGDQPMSCFARIADREEAIDEAADACNMADIEFRVAAAALLRSPELGAALRERDALRALLERMRDGAFNIGGWAEEIDAVLEAK